MLMYFCVGRMVSSVGGNCVTKLRYRYNCDIYISDMLVIHMKGQTEKLNFKSVFCKAENYFSTNSTLTNIPNVSPIKLFNLALIQYEYEQHH